MVQICGGASATEPLPFGVQSIEQLGRQFDDYLDFTDAELERSLLDEAEKGG